MIIINWHKSCRIFVSFYEHDEDKRNSMTQNWFPRKYMSFIYWEIYVTDVWVKRWILMCDNKIMAKFHYNEVIGKSIIIILN